MNKLNFLNFLMLLAFSAVFISCGEDDPAPKVLLPKMDGVYVYGTNTVAEAAVDPNARMALATLNPAKSGGSLTMEGYYGKYMHIGANSTIQISVVDGETGVTYGATDGGTVVQGPDELQFTDINDTFITGELVENGDPIAIAEEGLYFVFVNTVDNTFRIMRVEPTLIGDATPGQWSTSTAIPMTFSSVDSTIFEITDLELKGEAGYKVRFNEGYEVYNDNSIATLTFLGVEDYQTAWDTGINDLGFWDINIPNKESGVYTYRLKYDASTGEWSETKTKTGEILVDYSGTQLGIIGNAYEGGNWNGDGTALGLHTPVKSENTYTWTWNDVALLESGEFIFLQEGKWGAGLQIDYLGASNQGTAIDNSNIVDATSVGGEYHNYFVATAGTYDITLEINAETGARVATFTAN